MPSVQVKCDPTLKRVCLQQLNVSFRKRKLIYFPALTLVVHKKMNLLNEAQCKDNTFSAKRN